MDDTFPRSESMGTATIDGRWLLTHAVWRNGMGSFQPETGVRDLHDIRPDGRPYFALIEHGWKNFAAAQSVIEKGLRKGWSLSRVADVMERLSRDKRK